MCEHISHVPERQKSASKSSLKIEFTVNVWKRCLILFREEMRAIANQRPRPEVVDETGNGRTEWFNQANDSKSSVRKRIERSYDEIKLLSDRKWLVKEKRKKRQPSTIESWAWEGILMCICMCMFVCGSDLKPRNEKKKDKMKERNELKQKN